MGRTKRAERLKREKIERLRGELEKVKERQGALQEQLMDLDEEEYRLARKLEKLDPPPPPDPNTLSGMLEIQTREMMYEAFEQGPSPFLELFGKKQEG